jgi:3-hydroxyethyl bacteriochlorophyllide a dehydrogenase
MPQVGDMNTYAVVLEGPEQLSLAQVELVPPAEGDVVVDVEWSGISTGTERLLWSGRMPPFPGMGYPLVPGYESVGRVRAASPDHADAVGRRVFVAGARCFGPIRGLFGGAAAQLVVPAQKIIPIDEALGEDGVLLALAATAYHALAVPGAGLPDLVVGHGVLGRLLARIAVALGGRPRVWETQASRRDGETGYEVLAPEADTRRDYRAVYDVSGDAQILDTLIARLAPGGEIVLAGFYSDRMSFAFAPAFMREARLRVAAEWKSGDVQAVQDLVRRGALSLAGLITHRQRAADAPTAYRQAFNDPGCLKMVLDWREQR